MLQDDLGRLTPLAFRRGHKEVVGETTLFWCKGLFHVSFSQGVESFQFLHLARQFRSTLTPSQE